MKPRVPRQDHTPRRRRRQRWLLLLLALPPLVFAGLIALAPNAPEGVAESSESGDLVLPSLQTDDEPFHYIPDDEVYALDLDPREVRFGLLEGWDREQDAFEDIAALAYVSGPMYERHIDNGGQEITDPLGDLKFGPRV